ncbi:EscS/YscS/HrcS family type III secretion system export apparatus protein [Yokenella regensburgei]|uniref:EscS/YscS/HrcS family type III secretion system export apparatus protein n=1 Tax=Yokenella regensburgei TaxID=158877 RepID=UPI001432F04B|nr:EscS/YscS/HrcS family type III secretion system export apparatus protein [Yokenella regensburgei]QIU92575.1 EscS/YscS/HrcS family type III secretion system export apparatus protein [Yokenella regensburgei]
MNDLIYAGSRGLYLVLLMVAWPITVATVVGLLVGLLQTVTQLQEQTLPFGIKLFCVSLTLFLLSDWYCEILLGFGLEVMRMALGKV